MDFTGWNSSKEGEDRKVSWKGDDHSFLRCMRYNSYRLSSVEANDQWRLLCSLIGLFQQHFKEKNLYLAKKKMLFHQDNARHSYVLGTDGQIQISLRIVFPFIIFARFSPLRLFSVSKSEEMIQRKEIHHQRAAHRNRGLFWRTNYIIGQIIYY